jgi:hypothetical protein
MSIKRWLLVFALCLSACVSKPVAKPVPIFIYAAVDGASGDSRCRDFYGACLILENESAPVVLRDYAFEIHDAGGSEKPEIRFTITSSEMDQLNQLTRDHPGDSLAIEIQGRIVHAPRVRAPLSGSEFVLSYCDRHIFEEVRAALASPE